MRIMENIEYTSAYKQKLHQFAMNLKNTVLLLYSNNFVINL